MIGIREKADILHPTNREIRGSINTCIIKNVNVKSIYLYFAVI